MIEPYPVDAEGLRELADTAEWVGEKGMATHLRKIASRIEELERYVKHYKSSLDELKRQHGDVCRAKNENDDLLDAALEFIDESPSDPDITQKQTEARIRLVNLRRKMEQDDV